MTLGRMLCPYGKPRRLLTSYDRKLLDEIENKPKKKRKNDELASNIGYIILGFLAITGCIFLLWFIGVIIYVIISVLIQL